MSWITEWTGSLWDGLLDKVVKDPLYAVAAWWAAAVEAEQPAVLAERREILAQRAGLTNSPGGTLFRLIGAVMNIMGHVKALGESDLQRTRLESMKGMNSYPLDSDTLAAFALGTPDRQQYLQYHQFLQGKFPSILQAYWELARKQPDLASLREMYNRGIVPPEYVREVLQEQGFVNQIRTFAEKDDDTDWDHFTTGIRERKDQDFLLALFEVMPGLGDIVRMELRDAFPMAPADYPLKYRTPSWQQWILETSAHRPVVYDWKPGSGVKITNALAERTADEWDAFLANPGLFTPQQADKLKFGPQSYASWFIGAREAYTKTFERAAQAQGLNPYWAMKTWESHWQLPGVALLRQLLHRSPYVTELDAEQILRWQDYPPKLVPEIMRVLYNPLTRVDVRRMHLRGVLTVPQVFKAYLDHGYNSSNAANMTAFTVIWNMERNYGSLISEILKSYSENAVTLDAARLQIWSLVAEEIPTTYPPWVTEQLTPEQIEDITVTYHRIREQKITWISRELYMAATKRDLRIQRAYLETAQKMYTKWQWTAGRVREYLAGFGFASTRVDALLVEWAPSRAMQEKLPTRGMLEDFLIEQAMPVQVWRDQMRKLKYSDATIEAILEGTGHLPTRAMLEDFYTAQIIGDDEFKSYMQRLGYDNLTTDRLLTLLQPEVPTGD